MSFIGSSWFFEDRKERLLTDKQLELNTKKSNQVRADSLSSRGQSITRTREDIKESESKIVQLETQISAMEDSIGSYDLKIIDLESANIKGELGPLTYIAQAFNMEMDDVVKWFILVLVFVFDPLAVALIVAANMLYLKRTDTLHCEEQPEFTEHFINKAKDIFKKENPAGFKGILNKETKETEETIDDKTLLEPEEPVNIEVKPESKSQIDKPKVWRKWKSANWRE